MSRFSLCFTNIWIEGVPYRVDEKEPHSSCEMIRKDGAQLLKLRLRECPRVARNFFPNPAKPNRRKLRVGDTVNIEVRCLDQDLQHDGDYQVTALAEHIVHSDRSLRRVCVICAQLVQSEQLPLANVRRSPALSA